MDAHANALKRKQKLEIELKEIEDFLRLYDRFAGTKEEQGGTKETPEQASESVTEPATREKIRSAPRSVIKRNARKILIENQVPMTRGALLEALTQRGIAIGGADRSKLLGTVMWRMRDEFINIPGYGYWPKNMTCPKIDYDPISYDPTAR